MKSIHKIFSILIITVFVALMAIPAASVKAEDSSQSYDFTVKVGGESSIKVKPGESFDATITMTRTDDSSSEFLVYALTAVLRFNSDMFTLDSYETVSGYGSKVDCNVSECSGTWAGWSDITLNYLANEFNGDTWSNPTDLITLHFTAVSEGSASFSMRSGKVSTFSGMDSFSATLNDASVSVSDVEGTETTTAATTSETTSEKATTATTSAETKSDVITVTANENDNSYTDSEGNVYTIDDSGELIKTDKNGATSDLGKADEILTTDEDGNTVLNIKDSEISVESEAQANTFPVWAIILICVVCVVIIAVVIIVIQKKKRS